MEEYEIVKVLDLEGVPCPMNFVKTKLALESVSPGEVIEVILDEGEAITNVPRSVKEEGHQLLKVVSLGTTFRVIIRRRENG